VALTASPAGALTTVYMARTAATAGKVPWTLRQASGLTSLPGADGILYTHNDRGRRDSPAPGEDTANAAVWAIKPDGTPLARSRLTAGPGGPPIPYFDTEAIGHDPAGHLVLESMAIDAAGSAWFIPRKFSCTWACVVALL
jgi:hypothetical protein